MVLAHVMSQNCGINSGCDFCCTGGFCSVADDTADISDGVDDGQADILIRSAGKIGDGSSCAAACADGTAVSGKATNIFFLMNGDQIADNECAVQFILRNIPFFCKFNNRKRNGHTLVSTAGIDDNRKGTAAHTCIGTGSCAGTGTDFNVIAIIIQKGAAYLCSVRMIQAFIGNRRVHGDLTVKNVFDIFDSYCIGKFENVFDIQHAFIYIFRRVLMCGNLVEHFAVLYNA